MQFVHPYGTTVTFRHGPRPSGGSKEYDCTIQRTAAGIPIATTLRGTFTVWQVAWKNMPLADKTALYDFFIVTNGMADLFDWHWSDGTIKQVRFNITKLSFTETSHETYEGSIELME